MPVAAASPRIRSMAEEPDNAPAPVTSAWDLDVDAGQASVVEHWVSRISVVCLIAGGATLLVLGIYGAVAGVWHAGVPVEILLVFAGVPLLVGALLLQIASSISQHREDDARKIAWDEHVRSREGTGDGTAEDATAEEGLPAGEAEPSAAPQEP